MTLDGAIAHERENAKDHKDKAEYMINRGIEAPQINLHLQSETEQAEYHEQLAEWLEDYKQIKMLIPIEQALKAEYNKAIDDFAKSLKDSLMKNYKHLLSIDTDGFAWLTTDAVETHIDNVAEQLKAGEAE